MNPKFYKSILWILLFFYLFILVKLILFKFKIGGVNYNYYVNYHFRIDIVNNSKLANFIPFKSIYNSINNTDTVEYKLQNLLGNIIGFMPIGILMPLLFPPVKSLRLVLYISFLTSLLFETIQLVFVLGTFDVDDLMLNSFGGVLGYLALSFFYWIEKGGEKSNEYRSTKCGNSYDGEK